MARRPTRRAIRLRRSRDPGRARGGRAQGSDQGVGSGGGRKGKGRRRRADGLAEAGDRHDHSLDATIDRAPDRPLDGGLHGGRDRPPARRRRLPLRRVGQDPSPGAEAEGRRRACAGAAWSRQAAAGSTARAVSACDAPTRTGGGGRRDAGRSDTLGPDSAGRRVSMALWPSGRSRLRPVRPACRARRLLPGACRDRVPAASSGGGNPDGSVDQAVMGPESRGLSGVGRRSPDGPEPGSGSSSVSARGRRAVSPSRRATATCPHTTPSDPVTPPRKSTAAPFPSADRERRPAPVTAGDPAVARSGVVAHGAHGSSKELIR